MSISLERDEAVALASGEGKPVRRLLIASRWAEPSVDIDMSALLLRQHKGRFVVPSEGYFLYRNRRATPERAGFLTYQMAGNSDGPDRAQILLNLNALPADVTRIVVALSSLRPDGRVSEGGKLHTRIADIDSGETLFVYEHRDEPLNASCAMLWIIDRGAGHWMGRVKAEPYPGGPRALVQDHGVV